MSFIWHGFNVDKEKRRSQCFYEWHCMVCFFKVLFVIVRLKMGIGSE